MPPTAREVTGWLRECEAACHGRHFASGRRLFAEDALAFGTRRTVSGLANIERGQSRNVRPRIREFHFDERPVVRATGNSSWIAPMMRPGARSAPGPASARGANLASRTRSDGWPLGNGAIPED